MTKRGMKHPPSAERLSNRRTVRPPTCASVRARAATMIPNPVDVAAATRPTATRPKGELPRFIQFGGEALYLPMCNGSSLFPFRLPDILCQYLWRKSFKAALLLSPTGLFLRISDRRTSLSSRAVPCSCPLYTIRVSRQVQDTSSQSRCRAPVRQRA